MVSSGVCRFRFLASLGVLSAALLSTQGMAAEAKVGIRDDVLELTGGRRAKVVWGQKIKGSNSVYRYYDTKTDEIVQLPFTTKSNDVVYHQVWITPDGKGIVAISDNGGEDRALLLYDLKSKKVTKLASGPGSFPAGIWRDPGTKKTWVYINDCGAGGDRQRGWDAGRDKLYRLRLDNPGALELFWDRTTSHEFLTFSADGSRACFAPKFFNLGILKLEYDAKGLPDPDKSTYKSHGGGCFPGICPDNSYRWFRLDGAHTSISMFDAESTTARAINVTGMMEKPGRQTWLTRWSTQPRFLTAMAPCGDDAYIWLGRFDEGYTAVEKWVRISQMEGGTKSHAWIEPAK